MVDEYNPSKEDELTEAWLKQLAGASDTHSRAPGADHTRLLRNLTLEEQRRAEELFDDEQLERHHSKLLFKLNAEGLVSKRKPLRTILASPSNYAIAASVFMLAIGSIVTLNQLGTDTPSPITSEIIWASGELEIPRGSTLRQQVLTQSPDEESRKLASLLQDLSVPFELHGDVTSNQRSLKFVIHDENIPLALAEQFTKLGITVSAGSSVHIEFKAP